MYIHIHMNPTFSGAMHHTTTPTIITYDNEPSVGIARTPPLVPRSGEATFPHIQLTNPRICAFYAKNPTLSPEKLNLAIIDFYEKNNANDDIQLPITTGSPTYRKQIAEMTDIVARLKEVANTIATRIGQEYLFTKTEYLNEFRSVWSQSCCVSRREILLENNRKLAHSVEQITYDIRNIKGKHSMIGEKADTILRQFHKIIHTNIETILAKPTETANMVNEFVHNFETNSSHMIHTIQQLLHDYVNAKETQMKQIAESFSANGELAISAYCKFTYETADFLQIAETANTPNDRYGNTAQNIVGLLSRLYNTGYIQPDESDLSVSVLSRDEKPTICIQQLQIKDRNINTDEIQRFQQIVKEKNVHGILVSQYTGITSKPNLYIEIHHNRVYVYVHSMEYSPEKLQTAIDIVDTISTKLMDFNNSPDQRYTIPKDVLDEMNREYQLFIGQKETILTTLKDSHKKIISQIEELRFVSLDKYLSTRYSYFKKQGYVCNLCNVFSVSTLKGLAAHKRGCSRKHGNGNGLSVLPENAETQIELKCSGYSRNATIGGSCSELPDNNKPYINVAVKSSASSDNANIDEIYYSLPLHASS